MKTVFAHVYLLGSMFSLFICPSAHTIICVTVVSTSSFYLRLDGTAVKQRIVSKVLMVPELTQPQFLL